jgi:hypothetical protein
MYSAIKFWDEKKWTTFWLANKEASKLSTDNKGLRFPWLESLDGKPLDSSRTDSIASMIRTVFSYWNASGKAPTVFTEATWPQLLYLHRSLCPEYPEFRYCSEDWKLRKTASSLYSNWYRDHVKSKLAKCEALKTSSLPASTKRPHDAQEASSSSIISKKAKVSYALSAILPLSPTNTTQQVLPPPIHRSPSLAPNAAEQQFNHEDFTEPQSLVNSTPTTIPFESNHQLSPAHLTTASPVDAKPIQADSRVPKNKIVSMTSTTLLLYYSAGYRLRFLTRCKRVYSIIF